MSKTKKRDVSKSSRLLVKLKQSLRVPTWEDIQSVRVAIVAIFYVIYTAYLDRKIYILTGLAITVWFSIHAGVPMNLIGSIPILGFCYFIIYGHIIIWGAGRSRLIGRLFYFAFQLSAQLIISPIGAVLPPAGLVIGSMFWIAMAKVAPKTGDFRNHSRWIDGAKEDQYTVVKHHHETYVRNLEKEYGRVNKTMLLGIPLTDEEATTSFVVFGEVRSGKSLVLSMLMESLKE